MPELPEVETVVRELRPLLAGRTVAAVRVGRRKLRQPWQAKWSKRVGGRTIAALSRRGKWIIVSLDTGMLLLHLGMTGQLTVHNVREQRADHVHLVFQFDDDSELRFRDVRRFGSATYFLNEELLKEYLDDRLGPEPFGIDAEYFRGQMLKSNRPLKAVLLDQAVLAGVGNIYADESCFRAGLHPGRRANSLRAVEIDLLRRCIEVVLTAAVAGRGSTIRDYIGGSGLQGTFQDEFLVYGRDGKNCINCPSIIEVKRIGGRSSHYCPTCQPARPRSAAKTPRRG